MVPYFCNVTPFVYFKNFLSHILFWKLIMVCLQQGVGCVCSNILCYTDGKAVVFTVLFP